MPSTEPDSTNRFGPPDKPYEVRVIKTPILQMRKLRFRVMKPCVQSHEVSKWPNKSLSRQVYCRSVSQAQRVVKIRIHLRNSRNGIGTWD